MATIGTAHVTIRPSLDTSGLTIPNPIKDRSRGWLYVWGGIVAGPVIGVVTAVLIVLGYSVWAGVAGLVASGLLTISSTLARANLTIDGSTIPIATIADQVTAQQAIAHQRKRA